MNAIAAAIGTSVVGLCKTMTVIPIIGLLIAVFLFRNKFILTEEKMEEINDSLRKRLQE